MAPIKVGDSIPDGTLAHFDEKDEMQQVSVHSLAAGKKVVIFGVPGAFTPTCSMKHAPSFIEKSKELKSKGVEETLDKWSEPRYLGGLNLHKKVGFHSIDSGLTDPLLW
ncbi:putative thioredoxin-dependent peroxiredoxin [Helianthus annuus]|nr:putative thioredoxin-dependent peroxiredoxin [Helianthus annuus]